MFADVSEKIFVYHPTPEMRSWCNERLIIDNPDFLKKQNMGLWTGNIPRQFFLYEEVGNDCIVLPFGCLHEIHERFPDMVLRSCIRRSESFQYESRINLYPYQESAVQAILERKNGVLVMPCGSGKTQTALETVARIGMRALWITHTQDLLTQSLNRAKSVYGCDPGSYGTITDGRIKIGSGITFATVQTASKVDLTPYRDEFGCVVVDECMRGDTIITTPTGTKKLKNLCNDDIITSYNRKTKKIENKRITHVFKNWAHDIVKVKLLNGEVIICTENHPVYTKNRQWIEAGRLVRDDYVLRLVRKGIGNRLDAGNIKKTCFRKRVLLLFEGMFCKGRRKTKCLDARTKSDFCTNACGNKSKVCEQANERKKSYEESRNEKESFGKTERDWTQASNSWWKWNGGYKTSADVGGRIIEKFNGCYGHDRVSDSNKNKKRFWLPDLLQGRYCIDRTYDSNRNRWILTLSNQQTGTRYKKRTFLEWIRVDSVEVQEQTSDGTFGGLCSDGYVYNIEVEDNNNYFADGILVHNCHRAVGSPTKAMQFYRVLSSLSARYKIGLTATPKRGDGLSRMMFALLGDVAHEVSREEVAGTTCPVEVRQIETGYTPDMDMALCGDGTINYAGLVEDMTHNQKRFNAVLSVIKDIPEGNPTLVLANRVEYLQRLTAACGKKAVCLSGMGTSKKAREERKAALASLNACEIDCLFATYQLAAEGLDCPNLRYVVFATPEKNERIVVQAAGRVARKADGKDKGTVIDLVDDFGMLHGWAKKRVSIYLKKLGFTILA